MELMELFICDNGNYSENTSSTYRIAINDMLKFTNKNIEEIKKRDLIKYIEYLYDKGYKVTSINTKLFAIKSFLKYCKEEKLIKKDPAASVEPSNVDDTLPKYIDLETLHQLLEFISTNEGYVKENAIFQLFIATGIRVSELINIKLEDIKWEEGLVWITEGKGTKERFVPFTPYVKEILIEYLRNRNLLSPYLFVSNRNKPYTRQGINKMLNRVTKLSGIKNKLSPHLFRHTFATIMCLNGCETSDLAYLLGHEDENMTRNYSKLASQLRNDNLLSKMIGKKYLSSPIM